jgi:hypothetical protein
MMQSSLAQTAGSVENGMWAAAYANASTAAEKRALVERRASRLNQSLKELRAERRAVQAAFRNGTINRTTYLARLSTIVGRLASLSEGIEETSDRGAAVGVNQSRLQELRSEARNLSGPAVSRVARDLSGGRGPGPAGLFDPGPPDHAEQAGPGNGSDRSAGEGDGNQGGNASNNSERGDTGRSGGPDNPSNRTETGDGTGRAGNSSSGSAKGSGQAGSTGNSSSGSDNAGGQDRSTGNSSSGNESGAGSDRSGVLRGQASQSVATETGGMAGRVAVDSPGTP